MVNNSSNSTHFTNNFQSLPLPAEGNTPLYEAVNLAHAYGLNHIYLKDETQNPSGSFKDRAISYQLQHWIKEGKNNFVISSSGNAAISAAMYCIFYRVYLDIFLSSHTDENKRKRLLEIIGTHTDLCTIHYSPRARKDAFQFAKENQAINLVGSKDPNAIEGYSSLGKEIQKQLPQNVDALCMPISSGTGLLGLVAGLDDIPPLYAIQTTKIHPIADHFSHEIISTDSSLATAVSTYYTPHEQKVVELIKRTGGDAYAIRDNQIQDALEDMLSFEKKEISYDSALAIAGLKEAKKNHEIHSAICILTGI